MLCEKLYRITFTYIRVIVTNSLVVNKGGGWCVKGYFIWCIMLLVLHHCTICEHVTITVINLCTSDITYRKCKKVNVTQSTVSNFTCNCIVQIPSSFFYACSTSCNCNVVYTTVTIRVNNEQQWQNWEWIYLVSCGCGVTSQRLAWLLHTKWQYYTQQNKYVDASYW